MFSRQSLYKILKKIREKILHFLTNEKFIFYGNNTNIEKKIKKKLIKMGN